MGQFRIVLTFLALLAPVLAQSPLRLDIAGLDHGHVSGFLRSVAKRTDVQLVGVYDPNPELLKRYAHDFNLSETILFTDLAKMLDQTKPEAVATFTNTFDHAAVVETAASRKIPVMMEKPLAVNMDHARRIQQASARYHVPVIVNYETTWYRSHGAIWDLMKQQKAAGKVRRMVAMDGHEGPKEIHVQPEFFAWLSDPAKNGAGALYDFGCYGANLMTWLMDNHKPIAVTALARHYKPAIYERVDDDATILVQYPEAQGVIEASWNWPFSRKDFEVYGETGYAIATGGNRLRVRLAKEDERQVDLPELAPDERDSISYLIAIARGKIKPSGLSSLENNMIVAEILDAARESVKTGKTVKLTQ